jgi:hypothetical protein
MFEFSRRENARPEARLSRRSLIAAAAIIAAAGPGMAGKAFAFARSKHTKIKWKDGHGLDESCHATCQEAVCFLSGTRLLTSAGEVAIEDLAIGDLVATENDETRAIRWIGRITVDREGDAPWHTGAMPVRVAKNAFGKGSPHRDLYLSRSHMVHLNGVLIPIGDLINGRTIAAVDVAGDQLVYYHVELDMHDVVIAEGAPCETLLTTAEKLTAFDNADEYYALYGAPADMVPCAPLAAFNGGRSELKSRLRSAISPVVDIRRPMDVARDEIETRAFAKAA